MIRRKVAERIQARRRAASGGRQGSSSLPSSPDAVFSTAGSVSAGGKPKSSGRTDSVEAGFLLVDDKDNQSDSGDDLEDQEALRQAVAADDEISGIDVPGMLDDYEGLSDTEEEEEEEGEMEDDDAPPRSKLSSTVEGRRRAGALSVSSGGGGGRGSIDEKEEAVSSSKTAPKKPWQMSSDKEIYEQQLVLMQEQLTGAMIEKEELKKELEDLRLKVKKDSRKELTNLVKENRELSKKLESATGKGASVGGASGEATTYGGSTMTVDETEEGFERVTMAPDRATRAIQQRRQNEKRGVVKRIKEWFYDFLSDFTEEVYTGEEEEEQPALAAKKLKNNVQRFSRSSKPWVAFARGVQSILQWRRMGETLVIFLVYMYCVWNGWIMQVVAVLAIIKLAMNYLYTSGLAEQFGFPTPVRNFTPEELKFKDKIHVVKTVAQTCQNISGQVSDALEKLENLFLWHHPPATQRLFTVLCSFLVMSLVLPNSWTLTFVGFGAGIKLFIIDNIYRKYPKVKRKYDTVARLWKELPTNAELMRRQALTEEELTSRTRRYVTSNSRDSTTSTGSSVPVAGNSGAAISAAPDSPSGGGSEHLATNLSEDDASFCARFQLSPEEIPLPWWRVGRRCSLLDRSRPLSLTKSGKLYLTHSCLCFERVGRTARDSERILISLKLVKNVVKAKPFAVLPGSGMSIEVALKRGDKFTFSAMLNRDMAYQSILDQGMILGLPWGSDPIPGDSRTVFEDDEKETDESGEGDGSHDLGDRQEVEGTR